MDGVVRLRNVELVIRACVEALDLRKHVDEGYAILNVISWAERPLRINGRAVESPDEVPDAVENGTLEIANEYASIELLTGDRICKGFTDGEYAYMPCIPIKHVKLLLSASDAKGR